MRDWHRVLCVYHGRASERTFPETLFDRGLFDGIGSFVGAVSHLGGRRQIQRPTARALPCAHGMHCRWFEGGVRSLCLTTIISGFVMTIRNFEFHKAGEVKGEWSRGREPRWHFEEGNIFFAATWRSEEARYGWFGIYHPSLDEIGKLARRIAADVSRWADRRKHWRKLSQLSEKTPGWGLVRWCRERLEIWRDPIGRLPLFWARELGRIEWATRPMSLTRFQPEVRRDRLRQFLMRTRNAGHRDFWEGVLRIRAGGCLSMDGTRPQMIDWWPPKYRHLDTEPAPQRIADLLRRSLDDIVRRGGRAVSLSGGVDSSLLMAMLAESGAEPRGWSMVDDSSRVFDERQRIETLLDSLGQQGRFFDIGGKMNWADPSCHHPVLDFGPSTHAEAAYVRPFLDAFTRSLNGDRPRTLICGMGADQLFNCTRDEFYQDGTDKIAGWIRLIRARQWKLGAKQLFRWFGYSTLPGRDVYPPPTWLRTGTSRMLLPSRPVYTRKQWLEKRRSQFKRWVWESAMRLFERYRRTTGVLYETPYLTPRLVEFSLSLSPAALRTEHHAKVLLRRLLVERVPNEIAFGPKSGVFDEVIWRGLCEYFSPPLESMLSNMRLERIVLFDSDSLQHYLRRLTGANEEMVGRRYGHEFWRAVSAELWVRRVEQKLSSRDSSSDTTRSFEG